MQHMTQYPTRNQKTGYEQDIGLWPRSHRVNDQCGGNYAGNENRKEIDNTNEQIARLRDSRFFFHWYQSILQARHKCKPSRPPRFDPASIAFN